MLLQHIEQGLFSLILFVTLTLLPSHSSLSPFWCSAASSLLLVLLWTVVLSSRLVVYYSFQTIVLSGKDTILLGSWPTQCTGRLPLWCDVWMILLEFDCKQVTMATTRVCERLKCNNHQFTRTAIRTYRFYCIIHCVNKTVRKNKDSSEWWWREQNESTIGALNDYGHDTATKLPLSWRSFWHLLMLYFEIHCVNNKGTTKQSCSEWCWSGWNGSSIDEFKKDHAWCMVTAQYCRSFFLQKKTQGLTRYKYNIVCLSIMVQTVLEFVRQVFVYLPRLTGASS
jgi:hypothetical protein